MVQPRQKPRSNPRASWASRLQVESGPLADAVYKGIFLDAGLDDDLDQAAEAAGWRLGAITHRSKGRGEDDITRDHWFPLQPAKLHMLIDSLPIWADGSPLGKVWDYVQAGVWEYGIGARWPKPTPQQTRSRSSLGMYCLFQDLIKVGYVEPISFVVTSSNTDDLIAAMIGHQHVLDVANAKIIAAGKGKQLRFSELALPITFGEKVTRGSGELTSQVYKIASAHPRQNEEITGEYLRGLLAPQGVDIYSLYVYHLEQGARILDWAEQFAAPLYQEA